MSQSIKALLSLRERILNGEFTPGERLFETNLAEMLNVSRTPVRVALVQLAEEGLLEKVPGGGYAIREFTLRDIRDAIELRGALEGSVARLLAERGTSPVSLTKMKECIQAVGKLLEKKDLSNDDIGQYLELNNTFHHQLLHLSDSFVFQHMLERTYALPFGAPNNFVIAQSELAQSWRIFFIAQEHHQGIVEAIEQGQGQRAESIAREHAYLSWQVLKMVIRNKSAREKIPGIAQYLEL